MNTYRNDFLPILTASAVCIWCNILVFQFVSSSTLKGHSLEGPFRITTLEGQQLHSKDINVTGQLYKPDQDNQQLREDFDREGMQLAGLSDTLILKLSNMHESIRRQRHSLHDKSASPTTLLHFLLIKDGNISSNHKKRIKQDIAQEIGTAPAYRTRERDGAYVPDKTTFSFRSMSKLLANS